MRHMKRPGGHPITLFLVGTLLCLLPCCRRVESSPDKGAHHPFSFSISEKQVTGKLEKPGGLICCSSLETGVVDLKTEGEFKGFLTEGPAYFLHDGWIDLGKSKNPEILSLAGNRPEDLVMDGVYEFNLQDYFADFNAPARYRINDTMYGPLGLTLDLAIYKNKLLFSSSSSDKIFEIGKKISVYLQNKELYNIQDMVSGQDGKLYAVQAPTIDYYDSAVVVPKRVISIEGKTIKTAFELPSEYAGERGFLDPSLERLKIVRNTNLGYKKYGTKFYVSDLVRQRIYKVDDDNHVEVLAEGLRFPSSLLVDAAGDLFYTTSPLWFEKDTEEIRYPTSIYLLNPETTESTRIYSFKDDQMEKYTAAGTTLEVQYKDKQYILPAAFNISGFLKETKQNIGFLYSDSYQGTVKLVKAGKE